MLANSLLNFFEIPKYFLNLNIFFTELATVLISRQLFFRFRIFCLGRFYNKK